MIKVNNDKQVFLKRSITGGDEVVSKKTSGSLGGGDIKPVIPGCSAVRQSITSGDVQNIDLFNSFNNATDNSEKLEIAVKLIGSDFEEKVMSFIKELSQNVEGQNALKNFVNNMITEGKTFYLRRVIGAKFKVEEIISIIKKEIENLERPGDIKKIEKELMLHLSVIPVLISSITDRKDIRVSVLELIKISVSDRLDKKEIDDLDKLLTTILQGKDVSQEEVNGLVEKAKEVLKEDSLMIKQIFELFLDQEQQVSLFSELVKIVLKHFDQETGDNDVELLKSALKYSLNCCEVSSEPTVSLIHEKIFEALNSKGIIDVSYKFSFPLDNIYSFIEKVISVYPAILNVAGIDKFVFKPVADNKSLDQRLFKDLKKILSSQEKLEIGGGILLRNRSQHQQIAIIDQVTVLNSLIELRKRKNLSEENNQELDGYIKKILIGIGLMHDNTKIFPGSRFFFDGVLRTREAKDRNSAADANLLLIKAYVSLYSLYKNQKYLDIAKRYMDEMRVHGFANIFEGNVQRLLIKVSPDIEDIDDLRTFGFNSSGLVFESLLLCMKYDTENSNFWKKAIRDNFKVMSMLLNKNKYLKEFSFIRFENGEVNEYDSFNKFSPIINGVNYSYIPSLMALYEYDKSNEFSLISSKEYQEVFKLLDEYKTPSETFFLSPSAELVNMSFYLGNNPNKRDGSKLNVPGSSIIIPGTTETRLFESLRFAYNHLLLSSNLSFDDEVKIKSSLNYNFDYRPDLFKSYSENIKAIISLLRSDKKDYKSISIILHELLYNFSRFDKGLCSELLDCLKSDQKLANILQQLSDNGFIDFEKENKVKEEYLKMAKEIKRLISADEFVVIRENIRNNLFLDVNQMKGLVTSLSGGDPLGKQKALIDLKRDLNKVSPEQIKKYNNEAVLRRLKLINATGNPYYKIHPVVERSLFIAKYPQDIQQFENTISILESGYSSLGRYLEYVQRLEVIAEELKKENLMDNYFFVQNAYIRAVNNIAKEDSNSEQRESYLRTSIYLGIKLLEEMRGYFEKNNIQPSSLDRWSQELYRNILSELLRSYSVLGKFDVVAKLLKDMTGHNLLDSKSTDTRDRLYEPYSFEKFLSNDNYLISDASAKFQLVDNNKYIQYFLTEEGKKLLVYDITSDLRDCYLSGYYNNGLDEAAVKVIQKSEEIISDIIEIKSKLPYENIGVKFMNLLPYDFFQEEKSFNPDDFFRTISSLALQESFVLVDVGHNISKMELEENIIKEAAHKEKVDNYVEKIQKTILELEEILIDFNQSESIKNESENEEYKGAYLSLMDSIKALVTNDKEGLLKYLGRKAYELFDDKLLSKENERLYAFEVKLTITKLLFAKLYLLRSTFGNTENTKNAFAKLEEHIKELEQYESNVSLEDNSLYLKKTQIDVRQLRIAMRFEEFAINPSDSKMSLIQVIDKCFSDIDELLKDENISLAIAFRHEKNVRARFYQQILDSLYRLIMDNPQVYKSEVLQKLEKIIQKLIADSAYSQHRDVWLRGYIQKLIYGIISKLEEINKSNNNDSFLKDINEFRGLANKIRNIGYIHGQAHDLDASSNEVITEGNYFEQLHIARNQQNNKILKEKVPKLMESNSFLAKLFTHQFEEKGFFNEMDVHLQYKEELGIETNLRMDHLLDYKSDFWVKLKKEIEKMDEASLEVFAKDFIAIMNADINSQERYEVRLALFNGDHSLSDRVNVVSRINFFKLLIDMDKIALAKKISMEIFRIVPIGKTESSAFFATSALDVQPVNNFILDIDLVSDIFGLLTRIYLSEENKITNFTISKAGDLISNKMEELFPMIVYSIPENNTKKDIVNTLPDSPSPYSLVDDSLGVNDTVSIRYLNYITSVPLPIEIAMVTGSLEYDFNKQMVASKNMVNVILNYFGAVERNLTLISDDSKVKIKEIIAKLNSSGLLLDTERALQFFGMDVYKLIYYIDFFIEKFDFEREEVANNLCKQGDLPELSLSKDIEVSDNDNQLKLFKEKKTLQSLQMLTKEKIIELLKNNAAKREILSFILRPDVLSEVSKELYVSMLQKDHYRNMMSGVQSETDLSNPVFLMYEIAHNRILFSQLQELFEISEVKQLKDEEIADMYLKAAYSRLSNIGMFKNYINTAKDNGGLSLNQRVIHARLQELTEEIKINPIDAFIFMPEIIEGKSRLNIQLGQTILDYDNFNKEENKLYDDRVCFMPFMFEHISENEKKKYFRVVQIEVELLDLRLQVLLNNDQVKQEKMKELITEYNKLVENGEFNRKKINVNNKENE